MDLVGRVEERASLDRVVDAATSGLSGTCVLVGDAGMGKTRLLEYAMQSAPEFRQLLISGVEAETDLGYAALHRVLLPFLNRRDQLHDPQRTALESAFGLEVDEPADRFLVGLASLSLLADAATERRLLCIVDDAQWIDRESLQALSFVARRLEADGIAMLFGIRDLASVAGALDGLPTIVVGGLPDDAALALLTCSVQVPVDPETGRRIVAATSGCPLALIELASGLTQQQLRGGQPLGDNLPIGRQLGNHFLEQVRALDTNAQLFLLVAAAEGSGDPSLVRRAAFELGADAHAEDAALASGLIAIRPSVAFRHPLVRAAVYSGAPRTLRDQVHLTLATMLDRTDPDRRVQHLAAAAREPDEAIAVQLEAAAERSMSRGGYAAETSFLVDAAHLSPMPRDRARRLLRAATAAMNAGLPLRALALLQQARPGLEDPLLVTDAMRLDGRLHVPLDPPAAPARLLAAAHALAAVDPTLMRAAFLEALEACTVSQHLTSGTSPQDVAHAALATRDAAADPPMLSDLLLDGFAFVFLSDYARAVPILQEVAQMIRAGSLSRGDLARWYQLCFVITIELFDDASYIACVSRVEEYAREAGALIVLQIVLLARAKQEIRAGQFAEAEMTYDEVADVSRLVGVSPEFYEALKAELLAWRGREAETRAAAKPLRDIAVAAGAASGVNIADLTIATLELGLGRYAEALATIEPVVANQQVGWTCSGLAIAIEAATRMNDRDSAARYLANLEQRAVAAGTDWALGQLARCRALVADDTDAEDLYLEAITRLVSTSVITELAQARLSYGEWLRRQNRRTGAREMLRAAHDAFDAMGAEGFAARARAELTATGEKVPRRAAGPILVLTSQEAQAARLAAVGATNAEIATRMYISANTVDYHLRKVYRKLGLTSRRELRNVVSALDA